MAKLSQADLMAQFKEMTLVELSEFVKAFEEEFDVTAAAPVAVAAAGGAAAGADAGGQDEFTVILEDAGSQKIAVIKEVRNDSSSSPREGKQGDSRQGKGSSRSSWRKGHTQVITYYAQ
jgi:large subunit ribosomal protein L7/L12